MITQTKTNRIKEISVEDLTFKQRFPDHVLDVLDEKIVHFKVHRNNSSFEEFEFIIKLPYVIVFGDWRAAIYCFPGMKEINQLNGINNEYMECKCENNYHNIYFHKALQFYFDELDKKSGIVKPMKVEVGQNDYEFLSPDRTVAICSENCIKTLESHYGQLKQCRNVRVLDSSQQKVDQISFQHDNCYTGDLAKDTTGDLLSSFTVIDIAKIKLIEEKIDYHFDFENEETLQNFYLFSNVTRRYQFPLIVKFNTQHFLIAPMDSK